MTTTSILRRALAALAPLFCGACLHTNEALHFDPAVAFTPPTFDATARPWLAARKADDGYFRIKSDFIPSTDWQNECNRSKTLMVDEHRQIGFTASIGYGPIATHPVPIGTFHSDKTAAGSACTFDASAVVLTPWIPLGTQADSATVKFQVQTAVQSSFDLTQFKSATGQINTLLSAAGSPLATTALMSSINAVADTTAPMLTQFTDVTLNFTDTKDFKVVGSSTDDLGMKIHVAIVSKTSDQIDLGDKKVDKIDIGDMTIYAEFRRSVLLDDSQNTDQAPDYAPVPPDDFEGNVLNFTAQVPLGDNASLAPLGVFFNATENPSLGTRIGNLRVPIPAADITSICNGLATHLKSASNGFPFDRWDRAMAYVALFSSNADWALNKQDMQLNSCTDRYRDVIARLGGLDVQAFDGWQIDVYPRLHDFASVFIDPAVVAGSSPLTADAQAAQIGGFLADNATFLNTTGIAVPAVSQGDSDHKLSVAVALASVSTTPDFCVVRSSATGKASRGGRILFTVAGAARPFDAYVKLAPVVAGNNDDALPQVIQIWLEPAGQDALAYAHAAGLAGDTSCKALSP